MASEVAHDVSGVPANLARRSSRWVAIPVGQVSRWHWRAMSQPIGDERRRPERELLGAEERRDEQVAPGLEAAVGAQRDAVAQVVAQQRPGGPRRGRAPTAPRRA